jgi:hypothetical protein
MCVTGAVYERLRDSVAEESKFRERLGRYVLYPSILLKRGVSIWEMSSLAMLAEYRTSTI